MKSAVPPAHHPSEWVVLGWVMFHCTVLGSDWQFNCKVLKNGCQNFTTTQKFILRASDGMPISHLRKQC